MSILDGLLGKIKKEVVDKVADAIKNEIGGEKPAAQEEAPVGTVIPGGVPSGFVIGGGGNPAPSAPEYEDGWYDVVPAEECQYNYDGPFMDYFKKIFAEDFPDYEVRYDVLQDWRRYKYTFLKEGGTALVVELMSEKSSVTQLRRECLQNGIPYLRFYFDHQGWWNTRAYVRERVTNALVK
ncbi:MAG: hypothetical protein J5586_01640 [Clostridia bacterium]|nr:hypothetical protein [Clostridia bacterium]